MTDRRRRRVVRFDEAFDGSTWPGPLGAGSREAIFGEGWLGPRGLLALLETDLGLSGAYVSEAERAAALFPSLRDKDGYWGRSFQVDGLGTARRLLRDRDALWMAGWRGEPLSRRLAELAEATEAAPPGRPDRVQAVGEALRERAVDLAEVELVEPAATLPLAWQQVFEALARRGVAVKERPLEDQPASGDLAAAREARFEPRGDGTLQLVRPYGPLAAAEDVAAWLAAREDLEGCVLVGGDALLDRALERHGLPPTGAARADDVLLELLPLSVEMGWWPPDPALAFELLSVPDGPVPPGLAAKLMRALQDTPAVGSEVWQQRLDEGLEAIADGGRRERVRERVRALFRPAARRGETYSADALRARARALSAWATAREGAASDEEDGSRFGRVAAQCRAFERLLEAAGFESLSEADYERWLDLAADAVGPAPASRAGAGLGAVGRPDAIAAPARCIIWWNFERGAAPHPRPLDLSREEARALEAAGVRLPDPGARAIHLAQRWHRPLTQAREALLLVCPERGENGDRIYPHPLWDEIGAGAVSEVRRDAADALVRPLADHPAAPPRVPAAPRALPVPRRAWSIPAGSIGLREEESPSSLASLLGCSLQWALHYRGRLKSSLADPPPGLGPLLYGNVGHVVFERLAKEAPLSPEEAEARAGELFDEHLPRAAAALDLPGHELERADLRHRIELAARTFFQIVQDRGYAIRSAEELYRRPALGTELKGTPDLVLARPDRVVDLKYASANRHAGALREGTALQLAAYSYLAADGPALPPTAYFILRNQEMLDQAEVPPEETWEAVRAAVGERLEEMESGALFAEAVPDGDGEAEVRKDDALEEGVLRLKPPCRFCAFDGLCGAGPGGSR